jgi:anti-sigma B factor antagonist
MHWTSIEERVVGRVAVLRLHGHMTLAGDERALLSTVRDMLLSGRRQFVLSFEHVPFVDSVGLGEIVRAYSTVLRAGGSLRLCAVSPRIQSVLDATQLSRVLTTHATEQDAIASLEGPSQT